MINSILRMGHMRQFTFFGKLYGFELWWAIKPAKMWTKDGLCFIPWKLGIWKCSLKEDK